MDEGCAARHCEFRKLDDKQGGSTSTKLCDLPDSLLHYILSPFPTKFAVTTSVLSKRWQHVWESIPYLRLNQDPYDRRSISFCKLVENTLLLRDLSSVKEFDLVCSLENGKARVNRWITAAVRRNVQVLKLTLFADGTALLPRCIFRSKTLVHLKISMHTRLALPPSACLPNLKVLALSFVTFVDEHSTQKLLSCPSLEKLILSACVWENQKTVKIFGPKLLDFSIADIDNDSDLDCQVLIQAPQLKSFAYYGMLFKKYRITTTSSSELKAIICFSGALESQRNTVIAAKNALQLLNDLSGVRNLSLRNEVLEVLVSCRESLPTFSNMTKLIVECLNEGGDVRSLWTILERSPCIETLEDMALVLANSLRIDGQIPDPVPACFQSRLKKVVFSGFRTNSVHFNAVAVLLKIAMVLEEVVVKFSPLQPPSCKKSEEMILECLARFPKASAKCRIYKG